MPDRLRDSLLEGGGKYPLLHFFVSKEKMTNDNIKSAVTLLLLVGLGVGYVLHKPTMVEAVVEIQGVRQDIRIITRTKRVTETQFLTDGRPLLLQRSRFNWNPVRCLSVGETSVGQQLTVVAIENADGTRTLVGFRDSLTCPVSDSADQTLRGEL